MGLHDSGLCPLQNLFRVQFLDSVELQSELFLKAYLSAQKTHLQVVGAGTGDTVECSGLTSMPPRPFSQKQRQARLYPASHVPVVGAPWCWRRLGSPRCCSLYPRGGFVGLAAEITRCPVPFEFQINDECLSRFCAVLGPTHADKCSLFI